MKGATSGTARRDPIVAVRRYGVVLALLVLLAILGVASPTFFRWTNFANILTQWAPVGIMAVGTTFVIRLLVGFDEAGSQTRTPDSLEAKYAD